MKTIKELLPIEHPYVNAIINMLKEIDVDGETMEYILKQVGMDDQVVKQIIVTMNNVDLNSMLTERQTFLNSINKQYSFDSSHGELIINQHGDVLPKSELSDWLLGIEKVDVEELVHYYILNGFGNELWATSQSSVTSTILFSKIRFKNPSGVLRTFDSDFTSLDKLPVIGLFGEF